MVHNNFQTGTRISGQLMIVRADHRHRTLTNLNNDRNYCLGTKNIDKTINYEVDGKGFASLAEVP